MDAVPVLAGCNRHSGNGKIFVQLIKCRRTSATSCTGNACSHFHRFIKMTAVEQSVKTGDQSCICRRIVHRTCDYKTICCLKFGCHLIHHIIKNTFAFFAAGTTGNTATDCLVSDYNIFYFYTIFFENIFHLAKCNGCVAICYRASVKYKYF